MRGSSKEPNPYTLYIKNYTPPAGARATVGWPGCPGPYPARYPPSPLRLPHPRSPAHPRAHSTISAKYLGTSKQLQRIPIYKPETAHTLLRCMSAIWVALYLHTMHKRDRTGQHPHPTMVHLPPSMRSPLVNKISSQKVGH